jgi:hypothetical protein
MMALLLVNCPSGSLSSETLSIGIHKTPRSVDKLMYHFVRTGIEPLEYCRFCCYKHALLFLLITILDPAPEL